jgi:hypothetical protein
MGQSIHDQLLKKGIVKPEDAPAARRAAERAARARPEMEKELPPPFEAPPRGKIVESGVGRNASRKTPG